MTRTELLAELGRVQRERDNWELALWAAVIGRLDEDTAERIGNRMRELVR